MRVPNGVAWLALLRAMRHVPPGTTLAAPRYPETRSLLADLVRLPDAVAPTGWVVAERPFEAARIAGTIALRTARETVVGGVAANAAGWPPTPGSFRDEAVTPEFRDALGRERLAVLSSDEFALDLRELRGVVRRLPDTDDIALELAAELLELSEAIDPSDWLISERIDSCASIAIREAVQEALPVFGESIGPPRQVGRLRPRLEVQTGQIKTRLDELHLGPGGFVAVATVGVSTRAYAERGGTVSWPGFDEVADDQGYAYLKCSWEESTSVRGGFSTSIVRMRFYPRLAPGANRLTFACRDTYLSLLSGPAGERPSLSLVHVDPFSVEVRL